MGDYPTDTSRRDGAGGVGRLRSLTPRVAWVVAGAGVVAVVVMAFVGAHLFTEEIGQSRDLLGRVANLRDLRHTGNIYLPFYNQAFTYPPGAIFLFWPILWIPSSALVFSWALVSLGALAGSFASVFHFLWRRPRTITIAAACWSTAISSVVFPPIRECLGWGQTSTILLCLVAVDCLILRGWSKGVLVGLAAAFKIYPVVFILVWLWRRQWRAGLTALATAVTVTAVACVVWPRSAHTYFSSVIFGGGEVAKFGARAATSGSSNLITLISGPPFFYHSPPSTIIVVLCLSVTLAVVLLAARKVWRRGYEYSAFILVLIGSATCTPVAWDHYFTFAPLLALIGFEIGWDKILARVGLASSIVLIVPWYLWRSPLHWYWTTPVVYFLSRNAILLALAAVVTGAFVNESKRGVVHGIHAESQNT